MSSASSAATLLIDGEWRGANSTFEVRDPATLEVIGHAADASTSEAGAALDAASKAFGEWRAVTAEQRATHLVAAAKVMRGKADELAALLTAENGKPLRESRGEIIGSARMLEWAAEEGRRADGRVTPAGPAGPGLVLRAPVGPALAITPWNFPASMLARKVGLSLAAGCPLICKPAEQTPLIAVELIRIVNDTGLPAGVLQCLTTSRPADVVNALLADGRLRKISFTGSTEVGLGLVRAGENRLRRISLEMGGHAPAIVFGDADLPAAAAGVAAAKFANAGQSCTAINRLYVHRSVHDQFLALLVDEVGKQRVGRGTDPDTTIGPLIDQAGLDKVTRHVTDAVERGAKVVVGGRPWSAEGGQLAGAFFEPTVLTEVDQSMAINSEETFGPVLAVYPFDSDDEVVDRANDSDYGLASYVFAKDFSLIWRTLERLEFGVIGVNEPFPVRPELPFGGLKNSGQEREGGSEGIDAYLETKSISVRL